jgi:NAD(P)-dependent dehydrogenase (short-subunit alcohol dehydrogenase family)
MKTLSQIGREIAGLFVEDGATALAILLVVSAAALAALLDAPPLLVGLLLVAGTITTLCASVWRPWRR